VLDGEYCQHDDKIFKALIRLLACIMPYTKRHLLKLILIPIVFLFSGCSSIENEKQYLLITVYNTTESRLSLTVTAEHNGEQIFQQYIDIPSDEPDQVSVNETELPLEPLTGGAQLNIRVSLQNGPTATTPITLDCNQKFTGSSLTVRVRDSDDLFLSDDTTSNTCYRKNRTHIYRN
jgi:hypothetical protein